MIPSTRNYECAAVRLQQSDVDTSILNTLVDFESVDDRHQGGIDQHEQDRLLACHFDETGSDDEAASLTDGRPLGLSTGLDQVQSLVSSGQVEEDGRRGKDL